jgi:hypothetical protein
MKTTFNFIEIEETILKVTERKEICKFVIQDLMKEKPDNKTFGKSTIKRILSVHLSNNEQVNEIINKLEKI